MVCVGLFMFGSGNGYGVFVEYVGVDDLF